MNRLVLPLRYNAADAARIFWRPRARNLYGILRRSPVKASPDGLPASIELVWMPIYAFQAVLSRASKETRLWVSVDASYGEFALFGRIEELEEHVPEEHAFDPVLSVDEAERHARGELVRYLLRRRGSKPDIEGVEQFRLYHTPVWVYYFHRFGKKIDLAVLDGYTGDTMGSKMRIAVLDAFIRQREERIATQGTMDDRD